MLERAGEELLHLVGVHPVGHAADKGADLANHAGLIAAVEGQGVRLVRGFFQQGVEFLRDFAGVAALEHHGNRQFLAQPGLGVNAAEHRHRVGVNQRAGLVGVADHFFQQLLFAGLVGSQEQCVDHLGKHRRHLAANTEFEAVSLGLGEVAAKHQTPDVLQLGRIKLGFFGFAGEAGAGLDCHFQSLGVLRGHFHHPVGIREGVVGAKAAGQLGPGAAQLVAGVVVGALVLREGFPVFVGDSVQAAQAEHGKEKLTHGINLLLFLGGPRGLTDHRSWGAEQNPS